MSKFEHIKSYYGVPAEISRDVTVGGRKGTITADLGCYIGVTFHDDKRRQVMPCHPTSEVVYLDTYTGVRKLKPTPSQQRYRDFLSAEWFTGTFGDWLKLKKATL